MRIELKARQSTSIRGGRYCNVATGYEGCLANRGTQDPINGQSRQRTASSRLLNRKESNQTTDCYRRTISFDGTHFVGENKSFIKDSPGISIVCWVFTAWQLCPPNWATAIWNLLKVVVPGARALVLLTSMSVSLEWKSNLSMIMHWFTTALIVKNAGAHLFLVGCTALFVILHIQ